MDKINCCNLKDVWFTSWVRRGRALWSLLTSISNDMKQHYANPLPKSHLVRYLLLLSVWLTVQEGPPSYSQVGVIRCLLPCLGTDLISGEVTLTAEGHKLVSCRANVQTSLRIYLHCSFRLFWEIWHLKIIFK